MTRKSREENGKDVEEEDLPEDFCWDEELVVVHVFSQLRQVVHVRQLLPELVTDRETGARR